MRIVYLHQYFTTPEAGGGTRSYEFARRWAAAGHDVHVLRVAPVGVAEGGGGWTVSEIEGVRVHTLDRRYSHSMGFRRRLVAFGAYAASAARRTRTLRPDAVYATSTPLTVAIPAMLASVGGHTPFVFEVRDLWPDVPIALGYLHNPVLRWSAVGLEAAAYRRASHVVALAPGMKEDIVAKGVPAEKVSVIPQGCDLQLFNGGRGSRGRLFLDWPENGPLYVYAGAIGEANGLRYLVDLATAMSNLDPSARFVVIGEGRERPELEALAQQRGLLDESVFFLGSRSKHEVAEWMTAADATLAFLTGPRVLWKDAVQNKFFDSLAAGRPVATNNDGWQTRVAVEAGVGVQLDTDDTARGAEQLAAMVADQAFMEGVPGRCRELARTRFDRGRQAAEALEILESAVATHTS